jgi:hypothetical protein
MLIVGSDIGSLLAADRKWKVESGKLLVFVLGLSTSSGSNSGFAIFELSSTKVFVHGSSAPFIACGIRMNSNKSSYTLSSSSRPLLYPITSTRENQNRYYSISLFSPDSGSRRLPSAS